MAGRLPLRLRIDRLHHDRERAGNGDESIIPFAMPEPDLRHAWEMQLKQVLSALRHLHVPNRCLFAVCHNRLQSN